MSDVFDKIGRYYDDLVARHGHSPSACDYGSPASQAIKFSVLSEVMPLAGKSVLDVGCGFGDYGDFLSRRHGSVKYEGIDLSASMVSEAQKLHPGVSFRQSNFLTEEIRTYDIVSANGIFYLLGKDAPRIMREIIDRMFASARIAVAFNSLSSWASDPQDGEFYADPAEVLDYCRSLTPWITLRTDYHPRDFTIYMYREAVRLDRLD